MSRWLLGAAMALAGLFGPGAASAQNTYTAYLDTDSNPSTGCTITLPGGTFQGADARVQATATTGNTPQVTGVTLSTCSGGVFGAGGTVNAAHPVGVNVGVNGSDVVELSAPTNFLASSSGTIRLGFVAQSAGGSDVLFTTTGAAQGGPIILGFAFPIPALGFFGAALLAALVLLIARRHGRGRLYVRALSIAMLLLTGAGATITLAANFASDGAIGDWGGTSPAATDPAGDPSNGSPDIDIRAAFAALENSTLFFRLDIADMQTAAPTITSANATTFTAGVAGSFGVTATGVPTPALAMACAPALPAGITFADNGNGTGTLAGTPPAGSVGTYACTITANNGIPPNASQSFTLTIAKANTTTALTAAPNPSQFGETVTLTATVTTASTLAPAGTVTFLDGVTTLGTGTLNGSGVATFTTTTLAPGTHSLTAQYAGNADFNGSTSTAVSQVVNQGQTTTALASSVNPSTFGQSVTFTATVAAVAPAAGTPTGTVTFKDGATTLGTGTLAAGVATFTTTALAAGSHSITAVYAGDTNFATSTSAPLTQTVNQATTTTTLTSSANPSVFGQSVTFTATVAVVAPGAGTPTGTVTFLDGATTLGTGTLDASGQATLTTAALAVGSHTITAAFAGTTDIAGSTSAALTQVVNPDVTTTVVTSDINPSIIGQTVTFTATVTVNAPGAGTPTGTVQFMDGATPIGGAITLNASGVATFSTNALAVGAHAITAVYSGDTNDLGSTSAPLTQTVTLGGTTTALTSSVNPTVFGQPTTFTATVTAVAPATGTPTGTVTFFDGAASLATVALDASGVATLTTGTLAVGTHSITAVYSGDASFATSTSAAVSQVVNPGATTTTVSSSNNPSVFGQSVTFTAQVTVTAPAAGTPTGTVTFFDGATSIGSSPVGGSGQATFTTTTLAVATHSITATYGGDASFATSTSSALSQVVNASATTTTLASSANPSVFGQSVTFTATVAATAPGAGTPTGTVDFFDGATNIGSGALDGSGVATLSTGTLSVATHSITAQYATDGNYLSSTSNTVSQVVNAAATTTTLTSSANPSASGQSVTFTATVAANAPSTGTPTGTVDFFDGATNIGSGALNGAGQATFTTSALLPGTHTITATYAGDGNYLGSTSAAVSQGVNKGSTTTAVVSDINPSIIGQTVTFTATVSVTAPAVGTPTGTVNFFDGATNIGSGALNASAQATLSTNALALGPHSITAVYAGDSSFNGSTSGAITQQVDKGSTTTTVASSANPSLSGASVTFTATVAAVAPATGTPTGTATFFDGATNIGSGALNGSGQATFSTSALTPGTHSITAQYGGDANFNTSTSAPLTQTVNQAPAITSANQTTFQPNVAGTFTVTTTGFPTGASMIISETGALPAGVTFTNNNDGTATLAGTTSATGDFPITITANNGVAPNATQAFTLHVQQPPAITSANSVTFVAGVVGTDFTVTTTGAPTPALSETGALPSGVTFTDNGNGTATITNTAAAGSGGSYAITITANNGVPPNATQSFTINVNQAPAITSANNVTFAPGVAASPFNVTTTGFPTGASMAISETGALPTGVTFTNNNDGTATIAGTPAAGTQSGSPYALTITANNGVAPNATQGFTLNVTCPAINVSGTIPNLTFNTAMATATFSQTGGNGTIAWSASGLPTGIAINGANGQVTGTPTQTGNFNATITATDVGGCTGSTTVAFSVVPTATADSYSNLVDNTQAAVTGGSTASPTTPFVALTGSLLANDQPAGSTATSGTFATAGGGSVTIASDGTFLYTPKANPAAAAVTADSFTYTIVSNGATSAPATVSLTLANRVWYVRDNAPGGGNGQSQAPFNTIAALNAASTANDILFFHVGNTATTPIAGSVTMKNGQRLWGEGFGLVVNGNTLVAAGTKPRINNGGGAAVLANASAGALTGLEVRGLDLAGSTNAVQVQSSGANAVGITIDGNAITGGGTAGVNLSEGATAAFDATVSNNTYAVAGVGLQGRSSAAGTMTITASTNTVTASSSGVDIRTAAGAAALRVALDNTTVTATANGILFDGSAAGTLTVTSLLNSAISGNTGAIGISASSTVFDASPGGAPFATVSGGATTIGASGNGVGTSGLVLASVTGDLSFTDLDVFNDNGVGVQATSSGAFNAGAGTGFRLTVTTAGAGTITSVGNAALAATAVTLNLPLGVVSSTNSAATGVSLDTVAGAFSASAGSSITNATGTDFNINAGTVNSTWNGTITDATGRVVAVTSATGGTKAFTGTITNNGGTGILLTNNAGATINFSGGMALSTGTSAAFTATGPGPAATTGGTVNVTGTNTLATTTGTALNVANTTIGASGLTFQSVAANGCVNAIIVDNTGATAGLTVTGDAGSANNSSGGTIQNCTDDAIELHNTLSPSFDQINVQNIGRSGVNGTGVTNFMLTNSTINNVGTDPALQAVNTHLSSIAFNNNSALGGLNISGTLTVTNNTLTNAFYGGLECDSFDGTVTNAVITGNTITSSTNIALSKGSGIQLYGTGTATTTWNLMRANISGNTITNFPSGAGIQVQGGNVNASGPFGSVGTPGSAVDKISITGNFIQGASVANKMGTSAILVSVNGGRPAPNRSVGNFDISNNGTVANPLTNMAGTAIGLGNNGYATTTATINNNVIVANNTVGSNGIGGGNGVVIGNETPDLTLTSNNNNISQTDGNGILWVGRGTSGIARFKVQNNTVAAPLAGVRPGIRIDAGNAASGDDAVCLDMSGNTAAGSGGSQGLGLRKQGTVTTTNDFSVVGMAATASPGVEAYINGLNPAGNGTLLISATSGFSSCPAF